MRKLAGYTVMLILTIPVQVWAQQADFQSQVRSELADLKSRITRLEALLEQTGNPSIPDSRPMESLSLSAAQAATPRRAPALNTPPGASALRP